MVFAGNHSVRNIEPSGDILIPETEVFAPKVEAAWSALQLQYTGRISESEFDHLFACFVMGLTTPDYAEQEPTIHFDLCRALVAIKLPSERLETALHSVPEPSQPWVESARRIIESKGVQMGSVLRQAPHNTEKTAGVDANSKPTERLGNNEEMYND